MNAQDPGRRTTARLEVPLAYLLLVGVLAVAYRWHAPRDDRRLVITSDRIEARIAGDEALRGAPPTPEERRALISLMVEEEVLLREAERRRLHRDDPLIRSALLGGIARQLAGEVEAPTDEELLAHFSAHPERYATPPTVTIEQAVFGRSADVPPSDEVLAALRAGTPPESYGTVYGIPNRAEGLTRADLVRFYGVDLADAVLSVEDAEWHGPVESNLGTHFIRVAERVPSRARAFEEVRPYVKEDLTWERMGAAVSEQLEGLRARYDVRVGWDTR